MFNDGIKKPGGKVQRCIIVQSDENGFGLTVSGDNPVFVQLIKPGSAAEKAGVKVGDQIIKVNGMPVANSNHIEVVRLIKSSSYVALTLLGKDSSRTNSDQNNSPNSTRSGHSHSRSRSLGNSLGIQNSNPVSPPADSKKQDNKVNELTRMLKLEQEHCQKIVEEYMRLPTAKAQQELAESQTRIHTVEQQLKALTGSIPPRPPSFQSAAAAFKAPSPTAWARTPPPQSRSSPAGLTGSHSPSSTSPPALQSPPIGRVSSSSSLENGNMKSPTKIPNSTSSSSIDSNLNSSKKPKMDETDGHNFPFTPQSITDINSAIADSANSFDALFQQATYNNLNPGGPLEGAPSVISMEDDEFLSDEEKFDDHGPFIDLNVLKSRPAHLSVFLHFLMSNSNPVPLLFWLVSDVYAQETSSIKDLKRWAYEIYSTFIATGAPLKVIISEPEEVAIEESFNPKTSEERMKGVFDVSRSIVFTEVNEQLADFRNKRALGLGGLFGDHQLEDNLDRNKEMKVIEQTLVPHLDALSSDTDVTNEQSDRNYAMAAALSTFLKQVGIQTKHEKAHGFVEKEKGSFMGFGSNKKKVHKISGHQFIGQSYHAITMCNFCDKLLWGIGTQGYQCQTCEFNVHKHPCSESLPDFCTGRKKPPTKPTKPIKQPTISKVDRVFGTGPEFKTEDEGENGDHKPRTQSVLDDKLNMENSDDHEQDSESRTSTPSNEDSTLIKSKTIGVLRKVPIGQRNVGRSESVKTVRDAKSPKRNISSLPGLGKTSEFGVYGASPFRPHAERPEPSPPPESDEEDEPDSDLEVETENPNWQSTVVDRKILNKLKSKELKRQEVLHELIHTERTHVRNLKVLNRLFYKPMLKENIIPKEIVKLIFPNLEELIKLHESLLKPMKEISKQSEVIDSVGELMLIRFDGVNGEKMKEACATFCRSQKRALAQLKQYTKQQKVGIFMAKQESNDYCRRLQFTDIMATTHQRLVKYPLLLDSINKSTPVKHHDYANVEKCSRCCRDILNHVNNEIKMMEDKLRLEELTKLIEDKRVINKDNEDEKEKEGEGKFDISAHKLIMEGVLTWKINIHKNLNLHVVLLEDLLVLLQKTDNGKYILKNHNTGTMTSGENKGQGQSPIIKLTNVIIREVAVDKMAFFLVSTSMTGPQIYELVAQVGSEKRKWVASINRAAELMKLRDNQDRGRRGGLTTATVASPTEERRRIPQSPVEENEISNENENLPSAERLAELLNELSLKDQEINKYLEEKAAILAEMKGEKANQDGKQPPEQPSQPRDIVLAAIAQTKRLTEVVNSTLTKDTSTPERRKEILESTNMLQQYLTTLLNMHTTQTGHVNRDKDTSNPVKRSKSLEKPVKAKVALKQIEGSASTSALSTVISHARSHSSPAQTLDMEAVGVPAVEIRNEEELATHENKIPVPKVETLPPSETVETPPPGSPLPTLPPPQEEQEETHLLINESNEGGETPVDYFDI